MHNEETIWTFETANFRVTFAASPDYDVDLSWDDIGEVREKLERGFYVSFVAHVSVEHIPTGATLGEDWLGGCIYENPSDFIRVGRRDYFPDMVRSAVTAARAEVAKMKTINLRAA